MAIYIEIRKINENDSLVEYRFSEDDDSFGIVLCDKKTGDSELMSISDESRKNFVLDRVEYMLRKCYRNNEYPDNIDFMA